jgi:hypothetical protein
MVGKGKILLKLRVPPCTLWFVLINSWVFVWFVVRILKIDFRAAASIRRKQTFSALYSRVTKAESEG